MGQGRRRPGVVMARTTDYYAVLGVSRDASPEELKRRYRVLVRTHHPDVSDDPEAAHERFIRIVEAYRVLSDPVQRRAFDAMQAIAPPPMRTQSAQVEEQIEDWFRHAVHRMEEGDLAGAAAQCRKILGLEPQHAAAQAMLGDVYAAREEWDQALVYYSGAVSASPRNINYARKLRAAAESGQRARAAAERRERAAEQRQRAIEALNYRHEFGPYATLLACCWIAVLLAWMVREDGPPLTWPPLPLSVLLAAAGCGLAAGFALGLNRLGRPAADPELARTERWLTLAVGMLALGQGYLAVAAYAVLAVVRERFIASLNAALAAAAALLLLLLAVLWLAMPDGVAQLVPAVLWAGNVILPAVLLGQAAGRLGLRPVSN